MRTNWNQYLSRDYFAEFSRQHVIVAGGAQGIGKSLAGAFQWLGAKVSVLDRVSPLDEDGAFSNLSSDNYQFQTVDLVNNKERSKALEQVVDGFGPPHVFISTVGLDKRVPIEEFDETSLGELFAVNFTASVMTARDVMNSMRKGAGGAICLFTSLHGIGLYECGGLGYGGAKAALNNSIMHLAQFAGQDNVATNIIRVFGFCPGWVQTDNQLRFDDDEFEKARVNQLVPLLLLPEAMVAPVVFLLSNRAPFFTGEIFQFTGGERNFSQAPADRSRTS